MEQVIMWCEEWSIKDKFTEQKLMGVLNQVLLEYLYIFKDAVLLLHTWKGLEWNTDTDRKPA